MLVLHSSLCWLHVWLCNKLVNFFISFVINAYLALFAINFLFYLLCGSFVTWQFMLRSCRQSQSSIPINAGLLSGTTKETALMLKALISYCYPTYVHLWYSWIIIGMQDYFMLRNCPHLDCLFSQLCNYYWSDVMKLKTLILPHQTPVFSPFLLIILACAMNCSASFVIL